MTAAFIALPEDLAALADSVAFAKIVRGDWKKLLAASSFDVIHAFAMRRADIATNLVRFEKALKPDGMIWISWPKRAAKVATDVTEDVVRNEALALDLVDVKVAAIDHVWSGLKLVIRKERRRKAT